MVIDSMAVHVIPCQWGIKTKKSFYIHFIVLKFVYLVVNAYIYKYTYDSECAEK